MTLTDPSPAATAVRPWVTRTIVAIVLSGVYIAVEDTLEKAVAADLLPRDRRSLGFGILACAHAVGDLVSSVYVGLLLQWGFAMAAFGIAAALGAVGLCWMLWLVRHLRYHKHDAQTIGDGSMAELE